MKRLKKSNLIFIFFSIVILIACVLPVILHKDASISLNSAPAIVFGVYSAVYAIIAFTNKENVNLFVLGKKEIIYCFFTIGKQR